MKIILTGGGTGGHVTPAVAIGEEIRSAVPNTEILFIGRRGGKENETVTSAGIRVETVEIQGLKRSMSLTNFKSLYLALKAYRSAKKIIRAYSPDIIVGTGGYVTWPVVRAGQTMGIPTVIHESNVTPGLVTRLLAKGCDKVLLNHADTAKALPRANTTVTGNPIRTDFGRITREKARSTLGASPSDTVIVSFGGSGGSDRMNDIITEVMRDYTSKRDNIIHIHATGRSYYEKYSGRITKPGTRSRIVPFINNMPELLCAADVAITRCGALTLSELSSVGVASILIPSPNVTDDHQRKNGELIAAGGGAVLINESELTSARLKDEIQRLMRDGSLRARMAKCIEKFANQDARRICCEEIVGVVKSASSKRSGRR